MKPLKLPLKPRLKKQRGAITLLGVASIAVSLFAFNQVMEFGNAKLLDRKLDNYARTVASVALRSELAITQGMTDKSQTDTLVNDLLTQVGMYAYMDENQTQPVNLHKSITFGNFDADGNFVALTSNASNPKSSATPIDFSAVAVQIWSTESFYSFTPQGRAIYGVDQDGLDSPDIASCFCDTRYNRCLVAPKVHDVMGEVDSGARKRYCETGIAPSVSGGMMGMFFGGEAEYYQADTVKFSPQWVGTPYQGETVQTDQTSASWDSVGNDEPLTINSAQQPFPEAGWNPAEALWLEGNFPMQFTGYKKVSSFMGAYSKYKNPWELDNDTFYVGRSGTCAYPNSGFFGGIISVVSGFMSGNTDCIRYSADPDLKYEFASPIAGFMNAINSVTGANEHYFSCRDFSGLQSSRNGFFQIMRRIWTSPLQDWERSYQDANCVVKQMRYRGWWFWGGWEDV